ncbi:ABC transporter permease [Albibacterium bauzanense]|uniref:Putative ABC transport system permease protein n=1 Tax=Albibacterium bauzanense TaxID=653929 RepID=A0A4R1LQT4_9SPHI|nr:ABC transporter permease [Albibacterium bauzanense]TCK80560.1 putative ABC transport system permease protein [Albibacterium bauzanense]
MISYYIKIAWRSLLKQRMYSAIKIGGFAFSIAACILISLFIHNELSYDRSYPKENQIYRIIGVFKNDGNPYKGTALPAPLTKVIKEDFPEIELAGRLLPNSLFGAGSNQVMTADNNKSTYEEGFTFADQGLLDILQIPMVYGERAHALDEPNTIVISESKAQKYFPNQDPIGEVIYLNNDKSKPYTIKGVMVDLPATSHLYSYDFLLTMTGVEFYPGEQTNWGASNYVGYIQVKEGTDIKQFEKKLTAGLLTNHVIPEMKKAGNKDADELINSTSLQLQPVHDIHLKSFDIDDYKTVPRGDIRFVWLFGGIAIFILLIACINFINLSTAKSANRAKEVGMRKVAGSYRSGLISQFLTESMLYSFLSFLLGLIIAWLMLPLFNELTGKSLAFPWTDWWLIPAIICSTIIIGLFAGLYPAFYLSAFKPISVLKGKLSKGTKDPFLRSGLVVFQFTTSIILIIGTFIVYSQMQFILNEKIGYNKEQVLLIQGTNTLDGQVKTFKNELLKIPQVKSVSVGDYLPIRANGVKRNGNGFSNVEDVSNGNSVSAQRWEIDEDYIQTMGIELLQGRNFSAQMTTDSQSVIINEALVKSLGLKEPIGARITNGDIYTVIGVVQDFNFESLKDDIGGLCMVLGNSPSIISVKLDAANMSEAMQSVSSLWKTFSPNQTIRFTFLDQVYANMYDDVQRMGYVFTCFAVLAVIIACLGLFGLAAFSTEQRVKEIGIRKVLGASVNSVIQLLSKDFIKLVLIAILIATPIAWWAMNKWLQDFAYHIEVQWWMFVFAGLLAIAIALVTVSFQAIKAAIANPVDSLRDE